MNLSHVMGALKRRWYLTVVALLLAAGVALLVYTQVGPSYRAQSTTVLIPPRTVMTAAADQSRPSTQNQLLYLNGLTDARDIVVRDLASDGVTRRIAQQVPSATITSKSDDTSQSPLIVVESVAGSAEDAQRGIQLVNAQVPQTLTRIQTELGIQPQNRITAMQVTATADPAVVQTKQIQAAGLAGVGTIAVLLLGLGLVDGLATSRRTAKRQTRTTVSARAAGIE